MSIGTGIVLFVIGAILVFALDFDLAGVNIDVIGYILMAAGAVVFVIGLVAMFRRRSAVSTSTTGADPVTGARVTRNVTEADSPTISNGPTI